LALIVTPAIREVGLTATSSDVSSPPVITSRAAAIAEHHVEAVRGAPEPRDDHAGAASQRERRRRRSEVETSGPVVLSVTLAIVMSEFTTRETRRSSIAIFQARPP